MPLAMVTELDFEDRVLRNPLPVLVDLYADWCQPCKALEPVLEDLAVELHGKLEIVRVDVEANPRLAAGFRVQSIPMLVLFKEGRPVDQVIGAVDKAALKKLIAPVLPTNSEELEPKDLAPLIAQGRVVAVDVRDAVSFGRYHIPGAIHVEATTLADHIEQLQPTDGRLRVLYGRTTDDGKTAADAARSAGAQVGVLLGGFLHWEADGMEVERGG